MGRGHYNNPAGIPRRNAGPGPAEDADSMNATGGQVKHPLV